MQQAYIAEKPLGYKQIVGVSAATGIAPPAMVALCLITPSAACRWRDDGVAPTAAIGYPIAANQELRYTGANSAGLQFAPLTGTVTLDVTFYG